MLTCIQGHIGEIHPPFIRDLRREAPEIFKLIEGRRRDIIQRYFGRLLGAGRRAGIIRKDIPAKVVTDIILSSVQAIINPSRLEEAGYHDKGGLCLYHYGDSRGFDHRERKVENMICAGAPHKGSRDK